MAYQAIYRKWRPLTFEDIVGQGHITSTLKNQIMGGRIGHAYLFCGTRGTGKTTAAKVLARAVNCLNPKDGSPCNECDVCRGILDGSVMDVTEIDAASNNGVDYIRELREDTKYSTAVARYRVYIIDEVHMLSDAAFNALLKTLEEPPEHIIFILATTEAHKIPQTILSRCQRFDFKRIRLSDIVMRLKEIAYGDGITMTEDAFALIARLGDGSMRDALSVMERVVSAGGRDIDAEDINSMLSIADADAQFRLADAILSHSADDVFEIIDTVVGEGRDLHVFMDNMISHFRNLMICKMTSSPERFLDYGSEDIVKFRSQAEKFSHERIVFVIDALSDAKANCKWLKSPRVMYEVALLRLCVPELDASADAVADRLATLEKKVAEGVTVTVTEKKEQSAAPKEAPKPKPKKVSARLFNPPSPEELNGNNPIVVAAKKWDRMVAPILKEAGFLTPVLAGRSVTIDGDGIIMLFDRECDAFAKGVAKQYKKQIEEGFRKTSGLDCAIKSAYTDELEGHIIDIWALPTEKKPTVSSDPLDEVVEEFGDFVKLTDESDFLDFDPSRADFTQSAIGDAPVEDEPEEFLDEDEMENM